MMADAATSVVLAALLSAVASVDAVLMDAAATLLTTTVRLEVSTLTVSSLSSGAMSAISAISVVREVSQAFTASKPTLLKDQDSADSRAEEASITASADSVMSAPTRTSAVSAVLVRSKPSAVSTTDVVATVAQLTVSIITAALLMLGATLSSTRADTMSELVSPTATPTNAAITLAAAKLFQVESARVSPITDMADTDTTVTAVATVDMVTTADMENGEYFTDKGQTSLSVSIVH